MIRQQPLYWSLLYLAAVLLMGFPDSLSAQRMELQAFGTRVVIEVLGEGAEGRSLLAGAGAEIQRIESLIDPVKGSLADLNHQAGSPPIPVDPDLLGALETARSFCLWSEGRHGPLGGWLYALWALRQPVKALPRPDQLARGIELASCDRLSLDRDQGRVALAEASRLDLWGFDLGFAADRAAAVLEARGCENYLVKVGEVARAAGPGPGGEGWRLSLAHLPALAGYGEEIVLEDQALAVAHSRLHRLRIGGEERAPYLDQRNGMPTQGVVAVVAVTDKAIDAQGLAVSLFIAGSRYGQMLLGQLRPAPSVRWYLGSGEHPPLITDYRWSAVAR